MASREKLFAGESFGINCDAARLEALHDKTSNFADTGHVPVLKFSLFH